VCRAAKEWLKTGAGESKYRYNNKEFNQDFGLDWYDYGARWYDAAIGRFGTIDRFAEKYSTMTPYQYGANNPINFIDVNGDSTAVFRLGDGAFLEFRDDGKKDWSGTIITTDQSDNEVVHSTFNFADPKSDVEAIKTGEINKVVLVSTERIEKLMKNAGAFSQENRDNKKEYIKTNSKGGGPLDFSYSGIPQEFSEEGASGNPLGSPSPLLFLPEGDDTAHNHMNFGNFLWGAAGHSLGYSKTVLRVGAHANSLFNPSTNGYPSQFDSRDDQRSIRKGAEYSKKNNFRSKN
jgi:RHS repeat-associated protein